MRRSGGLARGALGAIARTEARRTWRRLLVTGLAAGLLGSAVVGVVAVARRTATAYDRLAAATDVEDAEISVFGDPALIDDAKTLSPVAAASTAAMFVGRVEGPGLTYLAIRSAGPDAMRNPVVVEGRPVDPSAANEVVVLEGLADMLDVRPGSTLDVCLLTTEEFARFDTGFGDPDGPCPHLTVVGIGRVVGSDDSTGIYTGAAFDEAYGSGTRSGTTVDVRLVPGAGALAQLDDAVDALNDASPPIEGAEEFPRVSLSGPGAQREAAASTARVLIGGLSLCALVAAIVGLLLVGQALSRQFAAGSADQRIEAALGITPLERCLARVGPALVAAGGAAVVTFAGALLAGVVEPLGPLGDLEPRPGWAPNLAAAVLGATAVALATLALAAVAAWRAGRPRPSEVSGPRRVHRSRPLLTGRVALAAGLSLALGRAGGGGRLPVRATVTTVVVGIAGVTAALTFGASLDQLEREPPRWGWNADVVVVDAQAETVDEVLADPGVGAATWLHQVTGTLEGRPTVLYAPDADRGGDPGWTLLDGRAPGSADEVMLGPAQADDSGVELGDSVELALADGGTRSLQVVGIGLGPTLGNEGFAEGAVVTSAALDGADSTGQFDELLVWAGAATDTAGLVDDLGRDHEIATPVPPPQVQEVLDLDRIPDLLAVYLAVVAVAALVNGLTVVVGRKGRDLATLRALGLTPSQVIAAVLSAALATAVVGILIGLPLGFGIGRLVWWLVVDHVGLATDVVVPTGPLVAVALAALVVAAAASLTPALRAVRRTPGELLRAD